MWEAMAKLDPAECLNATTPHYGPLLYCLTRCCGGHNVLEIGIAEGYSSGFMAWGVKENNTRFGAHGRFWGLDCSDKTRIQKAHDEAGLDSTFIWHEKGSVDFLENQNIWGKDFFDLIFIDGLHQRDYVKRELELVYPLLKDNGRGYIAFHDAYSFMESLMPAIFAEKAPDIKGVMRPRWEYIRFLENYGFALLRKMEGYDYDKVFWPDGDQTQLAIEQGFLNADGSVKSRANGENNG